MSTPAYLIKPLFTRKGGGRKTLEAVAVASCHEVIEVTSALLVSRKGKFNFEISKLFI
jgi:hypothetical protein